jgi:hypothetical protein
VKNSLGVILDKDNMFQKTLNWNIKKVGSNTLLIFALLILALSSVVFGLWYLNQDLRLDLFLLIIIVALLLSWLFARSKFSGWAAGLFLFGMGAFLIFFWIGDLWGILNIWRQTITGIVWQILGSQGTFSELSNASWVALNDLKLRTITLSSDLTLWLRALISGQPTYNYNAVSLVWGYSIWLVSIWAGWFQRRKEKPLIAILPAGLLLAAGLGYTYGSTTVLFPLIFAVLSLAGLTFYFRLERRWKARNMDYPEEERLENMYLIFGITIGFLVAAAILPRISIQGLVNNFHEWINPQVDNLDPLFESFGLDQDLTPLGGMGSAMVGGLPREHLIGSGPELSDQIVMSVLVEDGQLLDELSSLNIPLYWRGFTYDKYTGYGWESSDVVLHSYDAEEPAISIEEMISAF